MGLWWAVIEASSFSELVRAAAAGDDRARHDLISAFRPLAVATARRLVAVDLVDDVVQEALAELLAVLPRLRHPEAFPAWVRLTVRKHADRQHRRRRESAPLPETAGASAASGELGAAVEQREAAASIRAALATLRRDDRHLLELRYLADWSIADLAAALDITESAVRKRLHDARRRARPVLAPLSQEKTMTDYDRFLGHVHRPGELPFDGPPPPAVQRTAVRTAIPTGLKILDAIAPIARGGTVELVGPAGTGHLVLVVELSYRLQRTAREAAVVGVGSTRLHRGARSNLAKLVTEVDEGGRHAVIETGDDADGDQVRKALADGGRLAAGLAADGADVLLVVDRASAELAGPIATLKDLAGSSPVAGGGAVTLILVDAHERGAVLPPDAGMDTRLVFSLDQVALGVYPALDPVESRAHFTDPEHAEEVRRLLRAALDLRRAFAQPMFAAEAFTGESPTWVDREDGEREIRELLRSFRS